MIQTGTYTSKKKKIAFFFTACRVLKAKSNAIW